MTCDGQNLARASARLRHQPQIHGSRGKHNLRDLRRPVRPRCYGGHAVQAESSRSAVALTTREKPAQPPLKGQVEPGEIPVMRWEEARGRRTYPLVISIFIKPVDLWTLRGVTYSLEDGGLPGICSSNDEDPELDVVGKSGEILL